MTAYVTDTGISATGAQSTARVDKAQIFLGGTFTGLTAIIEAKGPDNNWYPIENASYSSPVMTELQFIRPTEIRWNLTAISTGSADMTIEGRHN